MSEEKLSTEVFSDFSYQHFVTYHFKKLQARLYNLAETIGNEQQSNAVKGLMRDFTDDIHRNLTSELNKWALDKGIVKREDFSPLNTLSELENEEVR
jgi:hypothetical protein